MSAFSHSRIGLFEQCQLQYKFKYVDREKVEFKDTVETFLGGKVHKALEKLYTDLKFQKLLSLKELIAYFNLQWKENWNDTIKINKKDYTADNYRKMGVKYLTDYYERYKPFNQGNTIGLETIDFLKLDKDYSFHIRIDRLVDMGNGVYEVHDYKTNMGLPKQEDLDSDSQLAMYSLWVKNRFKDFKTVTLVWHYVSKDKEFRSVRTSKQLEDLKKNTLLKIKKIEKCKSFEPNVTKLCDWCAFRSKCPMWAHSVSLEEKSVNEYLNDSGVKLVNKYVKFKSELKEYEDKVSKEIDMIHEAIVALCKKKGVNVLVGSDKKVTYKEYSSINFPGKGTKKRDKLIEKLFDLKLTGYVVGLDVNALKTLVKDDSELMKKLKKFVDVKVSERLSVGGK